MEFKFNTCNTELNKYIVIYIVGFIILLISENTKLNVFVSILLIFFCLINIFVKNKAPAIIEFYDKDIKLKFCKYFGLIERAVCYELSHLHFTENTEIYSKGVRNIVKVYHKENKKVIFKLSDDIHNENDLIKIVEIMLDKGCVKFEG